MQVIRVYHGQSLAAPEEILRFPPVMLSLRWGDTKAKVAYFAALTGQALYFAGQFQQTPWVYEDSLPGKFREKLWERDVIELFVKEDGKSRYQEFNLSPAGEWWSGVFKSARQPEEFDFSRVSPRIHLATRDDVWQVALEMPFSACAVSCAEPRNLKINICACIGRKHRAFFSAAPLAGSTPDFHQPDAWPAPELAGS